MLPQAALQAPIYIGANMIRLGMVIAVVSNIAPANAFVGHGLANSMRSESLSGGGFVLQEPMGMNGRVKMMSASAGFDLGAWFREAFNLPQPKTAKKPSLPVETVGATDAVLVLGATGKTGQAVVKALLEQGRNVVVSARSDESATKVFDLDVPGLFLETGVDVTDKSTLESAEVFKGVTQVVSALGPRFGEEGSSSEQVDFQGVENAVKASEKILARQASQDSVLPLLRPGAVEGEEPGAGTLERLDDVIMGGQSSSSWAEGVGQGVLERQAGETYGRWQGVLVEEGGGFCGTVIKDTNFDVRGYDGVRVTVRGDGSRFKFRLKPRVGEGSMSEMQYQAAFDTVPGVWAEVDLPFESFVAVKRNDVDYGAPRLGGSDGGEMQSFGLVLSRFLFNELPNPKYKAGAFQLDVKEISLYRKPRPSFVLISSAAAERYNRLSEEQRASDIPIVALNPQGILNWKYMGETVLRSSPLRHTIIRPTGLLPEGKVEEGSLCRLQVGQGDVLSGRVSREEVGQVVAAALDSPYTAGKTFELRRDEAEDAAGVTSDFTFLFSNLVPDVDRSLAGSPPLPPFPAAQLPPPPVSDERKAEILNDPRVKARTTADTTAVAQKAAEGEGEDAEEKVEAPETAQE